MRVDIPVFLTQDPDRIAFAIIAGLLVLWLVRRSWRRWRASAAAGRPLWRRASGSIVSAVISAIIALIGWSVVVNGFGTTLFLMSWFAIIAIELMGGTVSP